MKLFAHYHIDADTKIMKMPAKVAGAVAPWAEAEYMQYRNSKILEQKYLYRYYNIFIYKFSSTSDMTFDIAFENPVVAFQIMLHGNISYLFNGEERIELGNRKCRLFYFPGNKDKMILTKGNHEFIHFDLDPYFVEVLAGKLNFLQPFSRYLRKQSRDVHVSQQVSIDTFSYFLRRMRHYDDHGFELKYKMEILIGYILEKYSTQLHSTTNVLK
ncbi:MAG: hypothetical protein JST75_09450 [Bacteroidetes bacterium]|nr:hypothetical protein [Bacteroidota bacterium]